LIVKFIELRDHIAGYIVNICFGSLFAARGKKNRVSVMPDTWKPSPVWSRTGMTLYTVPEDEVSLGIMNDS